MVNKNLTKQLRTDAEFHKMLKGLAVVYGMSIKELLEGFLATYLPSYIEELNKVTETEEEKS